MRSSAPLCSNVAISAPRTARSTRFASFEVAKEFMQGVGLKSQQEWRTWCVTGRRPSTIPSHPWQVYGCHGWSGLPDFLGYSRPPIQTRVRLRKPPASNPRLSRLALKRTFLSLVDEGFDFQVLPHRSRAQLVYKPNRANADGRSWSPVILRSLEKPRRDGALFLEAPKRRDGAGVFFVITSTKQLFFLPHEFLDTCRCYKSEKVKAKYVIPESDAKKHELRTSVDVRQALRTHRQQAACLHEHEFPSALFSTKLDATLQEFAQQAAEFLRNVCGIDARRPTRSAVEDAHLMIHCRTVLGRCASNRPVRGRGAGLRVKVAQYPDLRTGGKNRLGVVPDVLFVFLRPEEHPGTEEADAEARTPTARARLPGFFAFPSWYLQEIGVISQVDERLVWSKALFYVYPPSGSTPRRGEGKYRQVKDEQFFFNVTSSSRGDAAERARRIFSQLQEQDEIVDVTRCTEIPAALQKQLKTDPCPPFTVASKGGSHQRRCFSFTSAPAPVPRCHRPGRFLPYEDAREVVHRLALKKWHDWEQYRKSGDRPRNIPSAPHVMYRDRGWRGCKDWLGYEKAMRPDAVRQRREAHDIFLSVIPASFEVQQQPFRGLAQLVYRVSPAQGWCPLVLRSVFDDRYRSLYFTVPKLRSGLGIVFIVRSSRKIFFIPHQYLDKLMQEGMKSGPRKQLRVSAGDVEQYEIRSSAEMEVALASHAEASTLLSEDKFSGSLFVQPTIAIVHHLAQKAADWLRLECRLDIRRPASSMTMATFLIGESRIFARCAVCRRQEARFARRTVYMRFNHDIMLNGSCSPADVESEIEFPDFLLVLLRENCAGVPSTSASASEAALSGFFLLPRAYLEGVGQGRRRNSSIGVYPPGTKARTRVVRQKQIAQQQYYISLSPSGDTQNAVEKVREILLAPHQSQRVIPG